MEKQKNCFVLHAVFSIFAKIKQNGGKTKFICVFFCLGIFFANNKINVKNTWSHSTYHPMRAR